MLNLGGIKREKEEEGWMDEELEKREEEDGSRCKIAGLNRSIPQAGKGSG